MGRAFRLLPILSLFDVLFPDVSAGKAPGRWYFPKPFNMSSPRASPCSGGIDFSMNFATATESRSGKGIQCKTPLIR